MNSGKLEKTRLSSKLLYRVSAYTGWPIKLGKNVSHSELSVVVLKYANEARLFRQISV